MTEGRQDGMTEGKTPLSEDYQNRHYELRAQVGHDDLQKLRLAHNLHKEQGPDTLRVFTAEPQDVNAWTASPDFILDSGSGSFLAFSTTFAPAPAPGHFYCIIAGELTTIDLTKGPTPFDPQAFAEFAEDLKRRNAALGLTVPPVTAATQTVPTERFKVARGFAPMHSLAKRNRGGLLLYPEDRRKFFELRTSLNWSVGLALFSLTSEKDPGGWQEVILSDLADRVFCLTDRGAPREGWQRKDILAEVVKLHTSRNASVRYNWQRFGRVWKRDIEIASDYAIPNLTLVFRERKTGRLADPSDPSLRSLAKSLELDGRRQYAPDGTDIKALPLDLFALDRIRWRWNPSFVDDLTAAPALDPKGNIKKDATGRVLRGGFNIKVAVKIFDALFRLRSERALLAHDLLVLLSTDIYKPPKQTTAAGRTVVEREADRLFDLLGLEEDSKNPQQREDSVAAAIYRLKQPDIAALLPGSDERPRPPSAAELSSGRRKSPFYRLVRSPDFTPPAALVSKEEAAALEAEETADPVLSEPSPKAIDQKSTQAVLPGLEVPSGPPIPTGAEIRAAREAAGMNLRRFSEVIAGPGFSTWSRYESGKAVRVGSIKPDVWQRVREFIAQQEADKTAERGQP